jgi:hypothetical protein
MTEQQLFLLEHEIQGWHARRARRDRAQPEHAQHVLGGLVESLRQRWGRWSSAAEQAETIAAVRLELLRAVARGEVSPETAHRVLSAR